MGLDDQQRPFVPLRMRQADRRGDPDARAAGGDVFQIDGADPFAAGLDDVFLAVGEAQTPVFVERFDVTGIAPAVTAGGRSGTLGLELPSPTTKPDRGT